MKFDIWDVGTWAILLIVAMVFFALAVVFYTNVFG